MATQKQQGGLVTYCVFCTLTLLILTTFLLRAYAHISVPKHAKIIVWLSWTLCFSVVYILPLDLRPHVGEADVMYPFYVALYWFCFFLTWILTPFQSAFIKSGGFSTKERLFDAVILNVIFFIVIGIVAVVAFVYLLVVTKEKPDKIGAVIQAFGNLWGLSFAIMAMGYGLVEVPRFFWYKSNYNKRLQFMYFKLCQLQESKEFARDRVDELLYMYRKSKNKYQSKFVYEFAKIDQTIPDTELDKISGNNRIAHPDVTFDDLDNVVDTDDLKRKHLRKMHMLFKIWLFQLERTNAMFKKTVSDVFYFEELAHINNQYNISTTNLNPDALAKTNEEDDTSSSEHSMIGIGRADNNDIDKLPFCTKLYYQYQLRGMPLVSKCVAVLLGILSIMVIWSEAMIIFDYLGLKPYLSLFALINSSLDADVSIIFGVLLFAYLSSCSLYALWCIHINKDYHMHPFQLTDSASMLANCAFAMRFMFPLGYNFLLMTIDKNERDTNKDSYPYLYLFHDMSVLPFIGDPVNVFLPVLVILFCLATLFNVFGKLMKKLRISRFEFGDPDSAANVEIRQYIDEGKTLSKKFKRELNTDSVKRTEFRQYIADRFQNVIFRKSYHLLSANKHNPDDVGLLVNAQHKQRDIIMKDKQNKFVELEHANINMSD